MNDIRDHTCFFPASIHKRRLTPYKLHVRTWCSTVVAICSSDLQSDPPPQTTRPSCTRLCSLGMHRQPRYGGSSHHTWKVLYDLGVVVSGVLLYSWLLVTRSCTLPTTEICTARRRVEDLSTPMTCTNQMNMNFACSSGQNSDEFRIITQNYTQSKPTNHAYPWVSRSNRGINAKNITWSKRDKRQMTL